MSGIVSPKQAIDEPTFVLISLNLLVTIFNCIASMCSSEWREYFSELVFAANCVGYLYQVLLMLTTLLSRHIDAKRLRR